ncbi:MAG: fibrobacter succinogenes major paralogous domain-containing protein [Chitinophagaceae bacterium]|nr:fibrobacter succinogenes major paralogous domain-containing protein [Chitinophagaceae bacterium]
MCKSIYLCAVALFIVSAATAQVGINTSTPHPAAILDVSSQNKGFLPPRMTLQERNAIPAPVPAGLMIWCTNCGTTGQLQIFNGTTWTDFGGRPAADSFTCGTSTVTFNYNGQTVIYGTVVGTGGKCWLDRNLGADRVANGITDAAAYGDLFQWGRPANGHQVRSSAITTVLATSEAVGYGEFIVAPTAPFDWRSPQNMDLWQGQYVSTNPCPTGYRLPTETEWDTERAGWSAPTLAGAIASPLKLPATGIRLHNDGSVGQTGIQGNYWSIGRDSFMARALTISGAAAALVNANRATGMAVRCVKDEAGSVNSINCTAVSLSQPITSNVAVAGRVLRVPVSGANGGSYQAQSISSTGVLGLTATLSPGVFKTGSDTLLYVVSGTATSFGTATFALAIGGQSCFVNIPVASPCGSNSTITFSYGGATVTYGVVVTATGRCWLDRNLGASRVATSSTDTEAHGDLFQWGRPADGHQARTSTTLNTQATSENPGHSNFIIGFADWRSPASTAWQSSTNPCPAGFRVPTRGEWEAELATWTNNTPSGAFSSPLKFTQSGTRAPGNGGISAGFGIWTNNSGGVGGATVLNLQTIPFNPISRATGVAVRCIKE